MNPAAPSPSAAYPTGSDREVLLYLMQQFDGETWECERCGHSEDTATMDSADYLRRYLAEHPAPAAAVGGGLKQDEMADNKQGRCDDCPSGEFRIYNAATATLACAHCGQIKQLTPAAPVGGFVVDKYAVNSWDFNGCHGQAVKALRHLAKYGRCPDGGSEFPNMECCQQIADELERSFAAIQTASPTAQSSRDAEGYPVREGFDQVDAAKFDAFKAAQPSAKDGVHDFSDNNGSACIVCGAGELFTGTPCPGAKDGVRGKGE